MKNIKNEVLKLAAKQIKKTAFDAAGITSYWLAYQPKEPKMLNKSK